MGQRNFSDNRGRERPEDRELRGDNYYYGGGRSQRNDWGSRAFDNNEFDRREGMYEAGGRDFSDRMADTYGYERGESDPRREDRGWWASRSPMSGERPWYDRKPSMSEGYRPNFTGGDRGWNERQRGGGLIENVKNFLGVGPKGYIRSDERIREDVCEALARHPAVDASDIEVRVKDRHVILTGTVESRWMKRLAEDAIEHVPGVHDVRVELTIPRNTDQSGDLGGGSRRAKRVQ